MKSFRVSVTLVLTLAVLLITAACSGGDGTLSSSTGNVRVLLSSQASGTTVGFAGGEDLGSWRSSGTPSSSLGVLDDDEGDDEDGDGDDIWSRLAEANVTFSSMLARNLDGELIDLAVDLSQTVDLVALSEGRTVELPAGTLPPGMYDELVVVISQLELVFRNGSTIVLTPPGGGWTSIVPVSPFEVIDGELVTIELKFRPGQTIREMGGSFQFFPEFDCEQR